MIIIIQSSIAKTEYFHDLLILFVRKSFSLSLLLFPLPYSISSHQLQIEVQLIRNRIPIKGISQLFSLCHFDPNRGDLPFWTLHQRHQRNSWAALAFYLPKTGSAWNVKHCDSYPLANDLTIDTPPGTMAFTPGLPTQSSSFFVPGSWPHDREIRHSESGEHFVDRRWHFTPHD